MEGSILRVCLLHDILDDQAAVVPEQPFLKSASMELTYESVRSRSCRLANYMENIGVKRGNRVAMVGENRIEFVLVLIACSRIGAIFVILNSTFSDDSMGKILDDSMPCVILATSSVIHRLERFSEAIRIKLSLLENFLEEGLTECERSARITLIQADALLLVYTSGSTGVPKGVVSSHYQVIFSMWAIQQRIGLLQTDVVGLFLPLSFDYGLYQIFLAMQCGATVFIGSTEHLGPNLLNVINYWGINFLPIVPPIAVSLLQLLGRSGAHIPNIRCITNTGSHLKSAICTSLVSYMPSCKIYLMYGLTECKRVSILDPAFLDQKHDSVGTPLPQTEVLIVGDDDHEVLGANIVGQIVVRGLNVMQGYWNRSHAVDGVFRQFGPAQETVLYTGDYGFLDSDGFLFLTGRRDDIFKNRGYRVSALEIEWTAANIDGVDDVACVPSDKDGFILYVQSSLA
ncbi:MAG: class I adenylate-forming enzyme family protein, partial [Bacilli bacterium]